MCVMLGLMKRQLAHQVQQQYVLLVLLDHFALVGHTIKFVQHAVMDNKLSMYVLLLLMLCAKTVQQVHILTMIIYVNRVHPVHIRI